jgi:pimeloyl-ACP methyl ester carboxylesterase
VWVLVHGFQGSPFDMRLLKSHLAVIHPKALCFCSAINQDVPDGDIAVMGANLADEVKGFVRDHCPGQSLARLSFLGYSMGGLIVRSALPHLDEFKDKFHSYVSLSSPHLGYVYSTNSIFMTGLWVAKKLREARCLEQLSMTDCENVQECFLYRLAKRPGLEYFKHVMLCSSQQDQYVPFESARIEMSAAADGDSKRGRAYAEMVENLIGPLQFSMVSRVDANFHLPETSLDTVIGRAAHIEFIQCQEFMRILFHTHLYLFE